MNYHYSTTELCKLFNGTPNKASEHLTFKNFSIDSRKVTVGDLFFAISGETTNGHLYIEQAFNQGASCAIVNLDHLPSKISASQKPLIGVLDPNQALMDLAGDYRQRLIAGRVIGITGSNGKTSAKEIATGLCHFLDKATHATAGNFNNFIGVPLTLLAATLNEKWWVIEMGSNQFGEIETLSKLVKPHLGFITNIGESHLEFLKNTEGVAQEKSGLFAGMEPNSIAVIPANLKHKDVVYRFAKQYKVQLQSFSFTHWDTASSTKFCAKLVDQNPLGTSFHFLDKTFQTNIANPLLIESLIGIITLLHLEGISLDILKDATEALNVNAKGRMEFVEMGNYLLINDTYNANPTSFEAVLQSIRALHPHRRLIVVAGAMAELGKISPEAHYNVGQKMKDAEVTCLFSYGDNDAQYYKEGWAANNDKMEESLHSTEMRELADVLKKNVKAKDIVLVKGSRSAAMENFISLLKH